MRRVFVNVRISCGSVAAGAQRGWNDLPANAARPRLPIALEPTTWDYDSRRGIGKHGRNRTTRPPEQSSNFPPKNLQAHIAFDEGWETDEAQSQLREVDHEAARVGWVRARAEA